jgi:Fe-S-cluster containining protein
MIEPSKTRIAAEKLIEENTGFREFLNERADPGELDKQFHELHAELFAGYDCSHCANCCRTYYVALKKGELESISEYLGLSKRELIGTYLMQIGEEYGLKPPCSFLSKDGLCRIQECKPELCRDYPYTDKKDRLSGMWGTISAAEHCPVVLELLERLKALYKYN